MERLTEWTGKQWIARQERLNGKIVGNRMCMERLAAYEDTELTPDEVETLKYLRNRYEDETYDYCGEYGTEDCQFKEVIDGHLDKKMGWIPVSERLPEVDPVNPGWSKQVLILTTGGKWDVVSFHYESKAALNQTETHEYDITDITLWIPLPEQYKAE